jgi:uncharacterized LabA/DUF88 family protein
MNRVFTYIDGFNLYFGLRSRGWRRYYWLNLHQLSLALLKPGQQLDAVHYFTARIRANGRNVDDVRRQSLYIEALQTLPDTMLHFGHYLHKPRQCRQCGAQWMDYEEKMTDVNIAVQMLGDAFDDHFDTALLISADSDLTTPVKALRTRFPEKRVIVALPPARRSHQLTKAANGYFVIGQDSLRASQLPEQIVLPRGYVLHRPREWK